MHRSPTRLHVILWGLSTLFTTCFTWAIIAAKLDPDFGWRIRHGQLILERGISTVDPFSYSMPSYPFVSHAWSFDILLAYTDRTIGLVWLSLGVAILVQLLCATQTWKLRFSIRGALLNLVVMGALITTLGLRAQVVALALVTYALWLILLPEDRWRIWRWTIPTLALFWANTHGSFLLLTLLLLVRWATTVYTSKKLQPVDFLLATATIPLSLINPYGSLLWFEVWQTLSDSSLGQRIIEWQPIWRIQTASQLLGLVFVLWGAVLTFTHRKQYPLHAVVMLVCGLLAISSTRHLPLAVLMALFAQVRAPFVIPEGFLSRLSKDRLLSYIFGIATLAITTLTAASYVFAFTWTTTASQATVPKQALPWLREYLPSARLYAPYDWGGYLIKNLPNSKLFIDNRMPSWRWQAPPGEVDAAMDIYARVYLGDVDELQRILQQFSVQAVLVRRNDPSDKTESAIRALGWIAVYQDATVTVYQPAARTQE